MVITTNEEYSNAIALFLNRDIKEVVIGDYRYLVNESCKIGSKFDDVFISLSIINLAKGGTSHQGFEYKDYKKEVCSTVKDILHAYVGIE